MWYFLCLSLFFLVLSVQSPGSLIITEGRWLTGSEVDAVQTLLKAQWSGHGLLSVTSDFTAALPRPFVQVIQVNMMYCKHHNIVNC